MDDDRRFQKLAIVVALEALPRLPLGQRAFCRTAQHSGERIRKQRHPPSAAGSTPYSERRTGESLSCVLLMIGCRRRCSRGAESWIAAEATAHGTAFPSRGAVAGEVTATRKCPPMPGVADPQRVFMVRFSAASSVCTKARSRERRAEMSEPPTLGGPFGEASRHARRQRRHRPTERADLVSDGAARWIDHEPDASQMRVTVRRPVC